MLRTPSVNERWWMHAKSKGKRPTCLVSFKHFLRLWTHFHHSCSLPLCLSLSLRSSVIWISVLCKMGALCYCCFGSLLLIFTTKQNKVNNIFFLLLSLLINIGMGKISTFTSQQKQQQQHKEMIPVNLIIEWKSNAQLIVFHEFVVSLSLSPSIYMFY